MNVELELGFGFCWVRAFSFLLILIPILIPIRGHARATHGATCHVPRVLRSYCVLAYYVNPEGMGRGGGTSG